MSDISAIDLCNEVVLAVQSVRLSFRSGEKMHTVLNSFWRLQDQLHRLVAEADDSPAATLSAIRMLYPHLIGNVVELLAFVSHPHFARVAGVECACTAINQSLRELQNIKQRPLVFAAEN